MIVAEAPAPPPPARPADLLFVFAGAEHRKRFAIEAWRGGAARTLVVSVARFEWRRVPGLGLPGDGGLVAVVKSVPPPKRLFQLIVTGDSVEARAVTKGAGGTWHEAVALAALARERRATSLLVCTSDYHLPRALLSVRRALARTEGPPCAVTGLAAPIPADSPLAPGKRWRSPEAWFALALEGVKYAAYAVGVPSWFDGAADRGPP
ncbi:MAG TPA: ElyC/SanA/YdcF family protein [Candidatus Eisenbacteria bacterium]|nr:ElyC/SanA/YdcF family protein [Candidatus Eisenbacteria bacterium]